MPDLGLVVRAVPYRQRSARTQLDVALAAGVLELELEIYFVHASIYQLVEGKDPSAAQLPPGMRGWNALVNMTDVRFYAEIDWLNEISPSRLSVPVTGLVLPEMRKRWGGCQRVLGL